MSKITLRLKAILGFYELRIEDLKATQGLEEKIVENEVGITADREIGCGAYHPSLEEVGIANTLKTKVEKQLESLHIFLNDPDVLDRIESYNDFFAPGNLETLKR